MSIYIKKDLSRGLFNAEGRSRTGTWGEPHQILSLARLPISSLRHEIAHQILSLARLPISSLRHEIAVRSFILPETFQISNIFYKNLYIQLTFLLHLAESDLPVYLFY